MDDITRINADRRAEVLAIMAGRPRRLARHIMANGKGEAVSALLGGACWMCGKTRDEILDCKDGDKCGKARN